MADKVADLQETKDVEINGTTYQITPLDPMKGLQVMDDIAREGRPTPELIRAVVLDSVTVNNIQPTAEWFSKHFRRNYEELTKLFEEIYTYNFKEDGEDEKKGKGKKGT